MPERKVHFNGAGMPPGHMHGSVAKRGEQDITGDPSKVTCHICQRQIGSYKERLRGFVTMRAFLLNVGVPVIPELTWDSGATPFAQTAAVRRWMQRQ